MQLRSGRKLSNNNYNTKTETKSNPTMIELVNPHSMRRHSRNYEEFNERQKYHKELLEEKMKKIHHQMRHLSYLNSYQRNGDFSFIQRTETIKEIYELFRYNMDTIYEYYTTIGKDDKRIPRIMVERGKLILQQMNDSKKSTRSEMKMYIDCGELILFVSDMLERHVLLEDQ